MTPPLEREPKISVGKKPAGRWGNLYLALVDIDFLTRPSVKRGEKYWGRRIWPSKDAAETGAKYSSRPNTPTYHGEAKYLGAFPLDNTQ